MNLAYSRLKEILPKLNEEVITPETIFAAFKTLDIEYHELSLKENGYYVPASESETGKDYVFLKRGLTQFLWHETLAHESIHSFIHIPVLFLLRKHELEAEVLALICMMPITDLKRLNKIKGQLDDESYELLQRRNKANKEWRL
jgi:hypothetical protein